MMRAASMITKLRPKHIIIQQKEYFRQEFIISVLIFNKKDLLSNIFRKGYNEKCIQMNFVRLLDACTRVTLEFT